MLGTAAVTTEAPSSPPPASTSSAPETGSASPVTQSSQPTSAPANQNTAPVTSSEPTGTEAEKPASNVVSLEDWRKSLAGSDEKILSEVARFKSLEDVGKELVRQKAELSKRAASGAFPEKGTPEQQAEWRKANNVPDQGTLEAYGVKAPEGYEMSKVEQAALGHYAEIAQKMNAPASFVQATIDTFFRAQAANQQMVNELNAEKDKTGRAEFDKQYGRDAQPFLAAANAFFAQAVPDEQVRALIANAQLPGGGRLASHPAFLGMMVDVALKNGFSDRIEGAEMESSGKSLATQQAELEALQRTDRQRYNDPQTQSQLKKIISLRMSRGEIDEFGNERKRR